MVQNIRCSRPSSLLPRRNESLFLSLFTSLPSSPPPIPALVQRNETSPSPVSLRGAFSVRCFTENFALSPINLQLFNPIAICNRTWSSVCPLSVALLRFSLFNFDPTVFAASLFNLRSFVHLFSLLTFTSSLFLFALPLFIPSFPFFYLSHLFNRPPRANIPSFELSLLYLKKICDYISAAIS